MQRQGFTLIELLVVIALIGVLVSLLLPALGSARFNARVLNCTSRIKHLGVGIELYLHDYERTLPQATGPGFDGEETIVGALFGGKKGQLPFFGIDRIGAERRPLNGYVVDVAVPSDDLDIVVEVEAFRSPIDAGAQATGIPGFEETASMYDLVGSSYTLNDHALDLNLMGDDWATLIPPDGGRMPGGIVDPTRIALLATHTLYNYDDGSDRGMDWFSGGAFRDRGVRANMLFLDLHAASALPVPDKRGREGHTTAHYTFLPTPDWVERYPY